MDEDDVKVEGEMKVVVKVIRGGKEGGRGSQGEYCLVRWKGVEERGTGGRGDWMDG